MNAREGLMFRARRANPANSGGSNSKPPTLEDALALLQQGFLKGVLLRFDLTIFATRIIGVIVDNDYIEQVDRVRDLLRVEVQCLARFASESLIATSSWSRVWGRCGLSVISTPFSATFWSSLHTPRPLRPTSTQYTLAAASVI